MYTQGSTFSGYVFRLSLYCIPVQPDVHKTYFAAQCAGASVGGMEESYLGYRIKFGGVGFVWLPLVAFLRMYCMPHKTFSSTEYILGYDSIQ